jgi:hypothetical protein
MWGMPCVMEILLAGFVTRHSAKRPSWNKANVHAEEESHSRLWLVLYTKKDSSAARITVSAPFQSRSHHVGLTSVVETAKNGAAQIIERSRIRVAYSFVPTQVVGAQLSSDSSMLMVVSIVRAADAREETWGTYFRYQAISCRDWTIHLPVIDVLDSSGGGMSAPIFSVRCILLEFNDVDCTAVLLSGRKRRKFRDVQAACRITWI